MSANLNVRNNYMGSLQYFDVYSRLEKVCDFGHGHEVSLFLVSFEKMVSVRYRSEAHRSALCPSTI